MHFTQDFTNGPQGLIVGNGGLQVDGGFTNEGMLALSAVSAVNGAVTNMPAATILASGSTTTFAGDVVNDGVIRTSNGATSIFEASVSGAGSYAGTGAVEFQANVQPGNSPALIAFAGDVVFGPAASLEIELTGDMVGEFDALDIEGTATLDGELEVLEIGPFEASPGHSFEIINAAGGGRGAILRN